MLDASTVATALQVAADAATGIPYAEKIAEKGMLGVAIILLLMVIIWQERQKAAKDKQINELRVEKDAVIAGLYTARLEDARAFREAMLAATGKVFDAVDDLMRVGDRMSNERR